MRFLLDILFPSVRLRGLLHAFFIMVVACGVACCNRYGEAEARLVAIDSLVCDQPDSALSLLADINGDSLPTDLQAYHSLLTVQALYKAYIPATSDTLIRRAWDYYRDHGPYDRRIRAMLYMGTVAEELGHPDSAMRWYKRTELESRPDDHHYRTFSQMVMGILYQHFHTHKYAIKHYREAISNTDSSTKNISLYCTQQLAQIYLMENIDSAKFFINQVSQYVKGANDSTYMLANMLNKSMMWFYNEEYDSAKLTTLAAIELFNDKVPYTNWSQLVMSCSKLDELDSAEYYFSRMPSPATPKDSIFYYEILQTLNKGHGKWKDALKYEKQSNNILDKVLLNERGDALIQVENQVQIEHESRIGNNRYLILALTVLLVLSSISVFVIIRRKRKTEEFAEEQVLWLKGQFDEAKTRIEDLQNKNTELLDHVSTLQSELILSNQDIERLKSTLSDAELMKLVNVQFKVAFQKCIQRLGDIATEYYEHGDEATCFIGRFKSEFDTCWKSQNFWTAMENHINASRNNAIRKIKDTHPEIAIYELHLVMLVMLDFDPMAIAICLGYKNTSVLYSMKNKLKKKLKTDSKTLEEYLETFIQDDSIS